MYTSSSLTLVLSLILRVVFAVFQKDVMKSRNKDLVRLFEAGFGVHHAGMLRSDRTLTERLFSDGLLKVRNIIVCLLLIV